MFDFVPALGIMGVISAALGWLLWKSSVANQINKEKHQIEKETLQKTIEAKDAQIKVLSDRGSVPAKQLLADGEF